MAAYQSQFAPYAPPPDVQREDPPPQATSSRLKRPWFPVHNSSQHVINSYQSGGIPSFGATQTAGSGGAQDAVESQINPWETRFGVRVDVLAAFAYILGPLSALLILVLETQNDYVRFHAYQSALLTSPALLVRLLASLIGFTAWLRTLLTASVVLLCLCMAFKAYIDANRNGLSRYPLPWIGQLADDWVSAE